VGSGDAVGGGDMDVADIKSDVLVMFVELIVVGGVEVFAEKEISLAVAAAV
jgi:hypothetical protein